MKPRGRAAFHACVLIVLGLGAVTLAAQTPSVVTVNSDSALVVNGRKVFSIGFSPGPPTNGRTTTGRDALEEFREAGALLIRMSQTTDWNSQVIADQQAALDWAAQHGMYCWVNLRELSKFAAGDTNTEASLRNIVNQFKGHPALGVWKNFDEAWWGGVSEADLQRGYDVIKQQDANHPVVQTHAPRGTVQDLQPYNAATDILALDIYPVGVPPGTHSLLSNKEISMVGDWTQFLGQVANGQKQYWLIEQIAWSGVVPPTHTLIFPTFIQERFMAYQAIINGARSLVYFGGNVAATLNPQDAETGWNWTFWNDVLKPVVRQLGDHSLLADALVAPVSALPITMSGTTSSNVEFCVREVPPYLYILACKREGVATNVTFDGLPSWAATGEVLYESPRMVTAQGGRFSDRFAPFDVHVYRFAQSNVPPRVIYPPQPQTNYPGMKAAFSVTADGTGPLAYQWRKNGQALSDGPRMSGVTSTVLNLFGVSGADAGSYDVVVTGAAGITSAPPALLVVPSYQPSQVPSFTSQPQSRTNFPGTFATFSVTLGGTGPFGCQWRKNGAVLNDGGNVSGATSWSLTLSNVSPFDVGTYDVVVSGYSSITSAPAALTVLTQVNQLLLYEPFAYTNIGGPVSSNTPANWSYGGTGANDLSVVDENLSYPGLASSVGRSVTNGGVGLGVRRVFSPGVNSGVVYVSALFRINDLGYGTWNGAAAQAGALTAPDSTSFRLAVVVKSNSPSGYLFGVQKGGSGATTSFDTTEYHTGETVFLVGKYDFTVAPNTVTLWIDPDPFRFGAASDSPTRFLVASTGTDSGLTIDRFNMRQNTATSVPASMQWDELRIGQTWADVTPPLPPLLTSAAFAGPAFQFGYTNNSGRVYGVFASTNLADWDPVGAATELVPGVFQFTDPSPPANRRFYQLR